MPVLSIVAPIYNMGEWLAPALESCLWQSHKDLEILVVDDGSTDIGPEIAQAYARHDSRIRLLSQANAGVGAARQLGQDNASGDYITWLDTDDFLDRHAAKNWLAGAADGSDLVCGNAVAFSSRTFNARRYFKHPPATNLVFDRAPRYWKSKVLWRWVFSLPFVRRAGLRHLSFKLGQDVCFMTEALIKAERFAQIQPVVYYFQQEHKSAQASLETLVEHGFGHFAAMRGILLDTLVGPPRIKPFVKYLNENYWRDLQKAALRLTKADSVWEDRIFELGFSLFHGLDPAWFRAVTLAPEVKEQTAFLPFVEAMIARDEEAARAIFNGLKVTTPAAPDKRSLYHTVRHTVKSAVNPLAWQARLRLRALQARAARRKGIPRARSGSGHHSGR